MSARLPILALLALPSFAEWLAFEITFAGSGCASCIESLPKRISRMRGVESAEVDAGRSVLNVRLAAGNRVRLELVRDQIEQDGTKVTGARVDAIGVVTREQDRWVFRPDGLPSSYPLEGDSSAAAGHAGAAVRLTAVAEALRPAPVLRLLSIAPRD
jgi:hypothetical protein